MNHADTVIDELGSTGDLPDLAALADRKSVPRRVSAVVEALVEVLREGEARWTLP